MRHLAGPVTDHTVVEVLEMQPTLEELQIAALHARGQIGHPNESVEELSGTAALIYDILMQDESYQAEDDERS